MKRIVVTCVVAVACVAFAGAILQAADAKGASVSIKDMQYSPATITVKAGQTVTWTNNDERDHTVVADDGSFQSDNISPGGTYQHKFASAGRYKYACRYHPRMKGEVIVTQ